MWFLLSRKADHTKDSDHAKGEHTQDGEQYPLSYLSEHFLVIYLNPQLSKLKPFIGINASICAIPSSYWLIISQIFFKLA